jgi:hypothetical protein
MGPQLILDKSSLQSLSYDETWCVGRHYYLVYAPILFIEILGDLKKHSDDLERSKKLVATVADKIQPGDSVFSTHFRTLLWGNLLGNPIEMGGRPVLIGGHDIVDSTGRKGVFFDEEPEREALRRWTAGEFLEAEHFLAARWRDSTRAFDLDRWRKANASAPKAQSLAEVRETAVELCRAPDRQLENLRFLLFEAGMPEAEANRIFGAWLSMGMPTIESYAPYAFYCLVVYMTFYLGLANHLIGSRTTNRVDLEYVLYLPFCRVFVSTDKFHRDFVPHFTKPDQDFFAGEDFKRDITRINDYWNSLSQDQRSKYRMQYGSHPPDWKDSVTNKVWIKHMCPRSEYKPLKMTPEVERRLMDHLRPMMDEINKVRRKGD